MVFSKLLYMTINIFSLILVIRKLPLTDCLGIVSVSSAVFKPTNEPITFIHIKKPPPRVKSPIYTELKKCLTTSRACDSPSVLKLYSSFETNDFFGVIAEQLPHYSLLSYLPVLKAAIQANPSNKETVSP